MSPISSNHISLLRFSQARVAGFTLVEIMIVIGIIALLAAFALPNMLRARKRSQASQLVENLRTIDAAIDQYGIENAKSAGAGVNWTDIRAYLKTGSKLYYSGGRDLLGNAINGGAFSVDAVPRVSAATFSALSDIAPVDFWSPYY